MVSIFRLRNISILLFLSIAVFLLQGCLAGAFLAGGAAAGSIAGDSRSIGVIQEDKEIAFKINQQINADVDLSNKAHIVVTAYNHNVLLAGQAPTQALRQRAINIAKKVPNVKRIFNQITIGNPTSATDQAKDAATTTNIRTRMLATTNLHSNEFKIVTENGVVYILGLSTPQQARIVTSVIRDSSGAKKIVQLIQYKK